MNGFIVRNPDYERDLREGFARQSLMSSMGARMERVAPGEVDIASSDVLSIEFKVNLLAPAAAPRFVARARVLRAGKTITVCRADVFGIDGDDETLVATMLGTMMTRSR